MPEHPRESCVAGGDCILPSLSDWRVQMRETLAMLRTERDEVIEQRDRWIRLFNRLDAAVSHHQRDADAHAGTIGVETWDEALYAARASIVSDAANAPSQRSRDTPNGAS